MSGALYLALTVLGFGVGTVLLRMAILAGRTDDARFFRTLVQTLFVFAGVALVVGPSGFGVPLRAGTGFAALNGVLSAVAFILYSKGLETVEASTAKPVLAGGLVVSVSLGILVLGESASARKLVGIALAGLAVVLLAGE